MDELYSRLGVLLADTYALYLKTQNYHWHVRGPLFKSMHELFEEQYRELAEAVDDVAERLRTLGQRAPATFKALEQLKTIPDGDSTLLANEMVLELANDHNRLVQDLNAAIVLAQNVNDEGTISLLSDRIVAHEKSRWMLSISSEGS